jgi:hypothetical protein
MSTERPSTVLARPRAGTVDEHRARQQLDLVAAVTADLEALGAIA